MRRAAAEARAAAQQLADADDPALDDPGGRRADDLPDRDGHRPGATREGIQRSRVKGGIEAKERTVF